MSDEELSTSFQELIGEVIDTRYRIDAVDYVRGWTCGLRGRHLLLRLDVDLKVVAADAPEAVRVAFGREAEITARMDHVGCVHGYEFGSLPDGTLYLVTSPVPPDSLAGAFGSALPAGEAVDVGLQLLAALGKIHEQGVVHGALRPAAIGVTRQDDRLQTTLSDFSGAHFIGEARRPGASPAAEADPYVAPELSAGVPMDPSTDCYSVGVILYHLLAGRGPFAAGTTPQPMPTMVPGLLADVVLRMMATDPSVRFDSTTAASRALQRWRNPTGELPAAATIADLSANDPPTASQVAEAAKAAEAAEVAAVFRAVEHLEDSAPLLTEDGLGAWSNDVPVSGVSKTVVAPAPQPPPETPPPPVGLADVLEPSASASMASAQIGPGRWLFAVAGILLAVALGLSVLALTRGPADAEIAERPAVPSEPESPIATPAKDAPKPPEPASPSPEPEPAPNPDALNLLASVNNADLEALLPFEERQRRLAQLRESPNTRELINIELNAVFDLVQANESPSPCETFRAGLEALEPGMTEATSSLLAAAEVNEPGALAPPHCSELNERLAALRSPAPQAEAVRSKRRPTKRSRARTPQPAPPAPPPDPAPAVQKPATQPKPKPKPKPKSPVANKLDDELRPFGQ